MCKLRKSTFGLNHSSRAWFEKLTPVMISYGLKRCLVDPFIFTSSCTLGYIILALYVDDIVITRNANGMKNLKELIDKHFNTKDLE